MRIIRRSKVDSDGAEATSKLILSVNVIQAKNLLTLKGAECQPYVAITTNGITSKTAKKSTANPAWNTIVKINLPAKPVSSIVKFSVFDQVSKHQQILLGELRLDLAQIFKTGLTKYKFQSEPRWYKINENSHAEIQLSLAIHAKRGYDVFKVLNNWLKSIPGEELMYYSGDSSCESSYDSDDDYISDTATPPPVLFTRREDSSEEIPRKRLLRKKPIPFVMNEPNHAQGLLILDFLKVCDLPPMRNVINTSFDMDPFIVLSFGKRVYKSSYRKHTLNPVYDESVAIDIMPHEQGFNFQFNVLDKDSFSYHDPVCDADVSLAKLMNTDTLDIPMKLHNEEKYAKYKPVLTIKAKYIPYSELRGLFWERLLQVSTKVQYDLIELNALLEKLGDFNDEQMYAFFTYYNKSPWSGDTLTRAQVVEYLQHAKTLQFITVIDCPFCGKKNRTKLNDLIIHAALCGLHDKKLLKPTYASSAFASKRWFSKVLIKLTYGSYKLGGNNANILVQDRDTGLVMEEKISAYVKLGIRVIYNGRGTETKRFKRMLKNLSVKQGLKFDSPQSAKDIDSFIKFHSLDLSQCLETEYSTFNEFFYRKLVPDARLPETSNTKIMLSPADCRCTVYQTASQAKEIWIKGRNFTIEKLTQGYRPELFNNNCSVGIFRLAPQDYHRFHSPCNGKILDPIYISGEYYTVNPMAIRSELDVFGENIRVIIPIETEEFGTILYIPVGAMMVGSIILTKNAGEYVSRGEEIGYFKFGGSTILILSPQDSVIWDTDLVKNSNQCIETLIKVGMSIGHRKDTKEYTRRHREVKGVELERIKRTITAQDDEEDKRSVSWEYLHLAELADEVIHDGENDDEDDFFSVMSELAI